MPKSVRSTRKGGAKKRAPAHQNSFAFKHNKHSKKSEAIAAMPNHAVCKRCWEKIEWKKKYRKYAYMAFDLEVQHYKRLFIDRITSTESGKVHMELINYFRVINSKLTNFGRIILLEESGE